MKVDFKKLIKPPREFTEAAKARFLSVFDTAFPAGAGRPRPRGVFVITRMLVACGALVALLSGVSVYADAANVGAQSALYPFKRFSENVQLAFTPAKSKPEVQATFATRRATEIEDLSLKAPSSTLIAQLSGDLNADVDDSVVAAHATNLADGNLDNVCGKIFSAITSSSVAMSGELSISAKAFVRFERVCAKQEIAQNQNQDQEAKKGGAEDEKAAENKNVDRPKPSATTFASPVATTSPTSSPAAHGPISPEPFVPIATSTEFQIRGGGSLNVILGHGRDRKHAGEISSGTGAAPATVFVPDVSGYVNHRDKVNVFDPQGDSQD